VEVVLGITLVASALVLNHRLRPKYHPLHVAFTTTTFGLLFLVAGTIGLTIGKSNWFFVRGTWSDEVIWWEVAYGAVALVFAAYFWRKGLQVPPTACASRNIPELPAPQ
jgi:drug/metabolite transporter (DMT)-like permease